MVRFGTQLRAEGVLAGSPQADRCIGYVAKYLTKDIGSVHDPEESSPRQIEHHDRLWQALRYEPCSPTCANWLRYGVQPRHAKAGLTPGYCKGKVHRRETLGFGGRRVLVSRKWSGKTLADHRADRRAWVRDLLGLPDDPDANGYLWVQAAPPTPTSSPARTDSCSPSPTAAAGATSSAAPSTKPAASRQPPMFRQPDLRPEPAARARRKP